MEQNILDYFEEQMAEQAKEGRNSCGFDTWGRPEAAFIYALLKDKYLCKINGKTYFVYHIKESGCGMGASPPKVRVNLITGVNAEEI